MPILRQRPYDRGVDQAARAAYRAFLEQWPAYAGTEAIDRLRAADYARLNEQSTGQPLSWQLLCQPAVDECVFYHTVNLPGAGTVRVSEASRTSYKARAARRRPSLHLNSPPPRLAVSQRQ